MDGLVLFFDKKGNKIREVPYVKNEVAGIQKTYFPGSQMTHKIEYYQKGKKNGLNQEFFKNGSLKVSSYYVNDVLDGAWYENYPNGKKKKPAATITVKKPVPGHSSFLQVRRQ